MITKKQESLLANGLVLLAVIAWGLSYVNMKVILLAGIPPITMTSIRYAIVALVFLCIILWHRKKWKKLTLQDHLLLALSGFTGITLYFLFESKGIVYTSVSNASLIIALIPIVSLLLNVAIQKKNATIWQYFAISSSFLGAFLIIRFNITSTASPNPLLGNLLMVGAVLCWVSFTFIGHKIQARVGTLQATSWQSVYGFLFLFPFSFTEISQWKPIPSNLWFHFLYLALVCSVMAYFFYNYAIKKVGVTVVSTYVNFVPVAGVLGGFFFMHEVLTPVQWIGACLIVASLFLVNKKKVKVL